jgi:polyphosphate kinase
MDFCTPAEHRRFLSLCPQVEKYFVDGGIILIKLWLEAGMDEQESRFHARIEEPMRQWKLSPMDIESYRRSYDYSRARDLILQATNSKHASWLIVPSEAGGEPVSTVSHIC